jgi:hypothetical protein
MKLKKPDWKEILIMIETFILFLILFRNWDEVKAFIA